MKLADIYTFIPDEPVLCATGIGLKIVARFIAGE